jgi:phosphoserine phosphatase
MNMADVNERRRIYLMRHAEVEYFTPTGAPVDPRAVTLTPRGRNQATAMASALAGVPFDRAVCSAMPRSHETAAAILAGREHIAIEQEPDFREIKAGRLRDVPPERRNADLIYALEAAAADGACFAGGESFAGFEVRVLTAFSRLITDSGWRRLLLVAHDAVNRVLLAWAVQAGLKAIAAFEQDLCCLNLIDLDVRGDVIERRIIRLMNYTPYDKTKAKLFLTSMEQVFGGFVAAGSPSSKE